MKNERAFTLIELLAAITIVAIISVLTVTTVTSFVKRGKQDLYNDQLNNIKMSAKTWVSDNMLNLVEINDCFSITLAYLQDKGYVEQHIKNPLNDEELDGDQIYINITKVSDKFSYEVLDDDDNVCDRYSEEENNE